MTRAAFFAITSSGPGVGPATAPANPAAVEGAADAPAVGAGAPHLMHILKHVFILAVSLTSTLGFILALWHMHVFAFVWSGLKHCRCRRDEPNCTVKYGPGDVKEIVLNWDESTGTTTSCMACSNIADPTDTNTNPPSEITNVRKTMSSKDREHGRKCELIFKVTHYTFLFIKI